MTPLIYPTPSAQAGILEFLFGRGGGNARGRRSGGGKRDECPLNNTNVSTFQALAPENNTILTRDTHPPFWFYIPFAGSDELRYAEFM
ncbi:MAG: DUF928 domain-containing protein, partial [Cyanothece sp. SIO2G6]|nr:DUF928 domain-containing protein [Cyanothece sp. SIO2G6]